MLDLARIVALLAAAHGCARARYRAGFLAVTCIAAFYALTMITPIASRTAPAEEGYAFVLAFWGPSGMPMPLGSSLVPRVLARFPMIAPFITGTIAWITARRAFGRAKPMRPELEAARAWDRAGMRFLFVAILDGILFVIGVMAAQLLGASR